MSNAKYTVELFTREINLKFLLTNDKISCVKNLYCRMLKKKEGGGEKKNYNSLYKFYIF